MSIFALKSDTNIQINNKTHNTLNRVKTKKGMETIYSTKKINQNFRIKVFGMVEDKKINMLVGVSGLIRLIGIEHVNKQLKRAFRSMDDKCECKLRRGLKITYYVK